MKDELKKKLRMNEHANAKEIETVVVLGNYVVPGTVNPHNKDRKSNRCAFFTIEWKEKVFPESKKGILRINCRYMTLADGSLFHA